MRGIMCEISDIEAKGVRVRLADAPSKAAFNETVIC